MEQLELDLQRAYTKMLNFDKQKARRKEELSQCTKKKKNSATIGVGVADGTHILFTLPKVEVL